MRPKLYLFGDSITEESYCDGGWGASLSHHFSRAADVVLRGYSGYNTRWALKVLEIAFPLDMDKSHNRVPAAMTIFFGANDACLPDRCSSFQHVPVDEYTRNIRELVTYFKNRWPTTKIILITPPPIDEAGRLLHPFVHPFVENALGLPERTNEAAGEYAKACVAVGDELKVPVVDLWTRMQSFPDWQRAYLRDGLHLTPGGNRIVFEEMIGKLREAGFSLESLPVDLPLIAEIDPNDPLRIFNK